MTIPLIEQVGITLRAANQNIIASTAGQEILVSSKVDTQRVISSPPIQGVATFPAFDQVIPCSAPNFVITIATIKHIVPRRA